MSYPVLKNQGGFVGIAKHQPMTVYTEKLTWRKWAFIYKSHTAKTKTKFEPSRTHDKQHMQFWTIYKSLSWESTFSSQAHTEWEQLEMLVLFSISPLQGHHSEWKSGTNAKFCSVANLYSVLTKIRVWAELVTTSEINGPQVQKQMCSDYAENRVNTSTLFP